MLDTEGHLQPAFDSKRPGFKIDLPEPHRDLAPAVVDLLASYQIERQIRRNKNEGPNRLKKEVQISSEFKALWDRIKRKTQFRVEFETDELIRRAVAAIKIMSKIEAATIRVTTGKLDVVKGGVTAPARAILETNFAGRYSRRARSETILAVTTALSRLGQGPQFPALERNASS